MPCRGRPFEPGASRPARGRHELDPAWIALAGQCDERQHRGENEHTPVSSETRRPRL